MINKLIDDIATVFKNHKLLFYIGGVATIIHAISGWSLIVKATVDLF